jgi:hypothetical protein
MQIWNLATMTRDAVFILGRLSAAGAAAARTKALVRGEAATAPRALGEAEPIPAAPTGGGVHVGLTEEQSEAVHELAEMLAENGKWTDLPGKTRTMLGTVLHSVVEALAGYIFRGVGRVLRGVDITAEGIANLRKAGGRVLFIESRVPAGERMLRLDLAEVNFAEQRATLVDLTSIDRSEHVAKTAAGGEALEHVTGIPVSAMEMRYVGDERKLLERLLEAVVTE